MRKKQKVINLFNNKNIYSIKHVISISCEEDLNQFWDFTTNSNSTRYELLHTFITQFYNFAIFYIRDVNTTFFDIILEESDENFYFTLWNKKLSLAFESHMQKSSLKYICTDSRISIKLDKSKYLNKIKKINLKHEKRQKHLLCPKIKKQKPYTFIEDNDLLELQKLNDDIQDIVYRIKKSALNDNSFISLRSSISLFCFTLRYYEKISPMATILTEFSNLLNTNEKAFKNLEFEKFELVLGFIQNIESWMNTLFKSGGVDLYYMDNSMKADLMIIEQVIIPESSSLDEFDSLDDIFDF